MQRLEMLDAAGLPEIYTTHMGLIEDAGDGMLRVVRCVKRHGVLVPRVCIIMPALNVIEDRERFRVAAEQARRQLLAPLHELRMDGVTH